MVCGYELTSSCVMSKVVPMLKHQCLPHIFRTVPFIHYSYILFFRGLAGFFRGFSGLAGFSLPLHLECCLRVSWSVKFCSPAICFSPAYRSWSFTDRWQWRPMSYKFGLVDHHALDRFLHKPVFGIENCVFPGFSIIVSLWFCFGHINQCMSHDQSDSGCRHLGNSGAVSFEIPVFLARAVEDSNLVFSERMNKHMLVSEGQAIDRCMDVCLT